MVVISMVLYWRLKVLYCLDYYEYRKETSITVRNY